MSSINLQNALMRPAVLQILRAAGFHNSSMAALDVMTDLAIRYLSLLAFSTAQNAFNNHEDYIPTIQDVRMALLEAGALRPQMSVLEERAKGLVKVNDESVPFEDMRGVEGFLNWARGPSNYEIRRIAGFASGSGEMVEVGVEEHEDYVTGLISEPHQWSKMLRADLLPALKNKYNKTGEDSRYRGTLLGKEADPQPVTIVGGPAGSIHEWGTKLRSRAMVPQLSSPAYSGILSSAPLTPMDETFGRE
jgi:transcription initiation factor TFIID subunit 3